ncbi:retrovirus-related pol polyprotein from transposon TNT 1-94 [Tanacetum coccineum]
MYTMEGFGANGLLCVSFGEMGVSVVMRVRWGQDFMVVVLTTKEQGLVAETFDWDEEEVSDEEEVNRSSNVSVSKFSSKKKKVLGGELLPKSSSKMNENEKSFSFCFPMGILVPERQAVNESLEPTETLNTPESSKDSEAESFTLLPPLKNLQGALPSSKVTLLTFQPHSLRERPSLGSSWQFDAKADDGYFLGYSSVSKTFRVYNTRRQQIKETYHVTFDESMEAIRQYQVDSDVSYYIIPYGRSLTKITQENHVPEVIALNEREIPHTEDTEGPPDLINTKGTHEQNVQNDKMITQPTDTPSGNNIEGPGPITKPLVPDVTQSHILNQASISMLTRSMATKLIAALASECLFADFLSEIELKKEEGIDYDETFTPVARMKAIRIFLAFATYMNFKFYQIDVKSAFLNDKLKEEVYVKQPPGFENSEFPDYVCKLDKALYGLKQAPRAWYETLSTFLIQNKFTKEE